MTAVSNTVAPESLTDGRSLGDIEEPELAQILVGNISGNRGRQLIQDYVWGVGDAEARDRKSEPLVEALGKGNWPEDLSVYVPNQDPSQEPEYITYQNLSKQPDVVAAILSYNLTTSDLETLVTAEVVQPFVVATWTLDRTLLDYKGIEKELDVINNSRRESDPDWNDARLQFRSWLSLNFVTQRLNAAPELTGMRNAILGSLLMISITALFAFPIGIGAAIYLEEYANDNWINRIIQTNIDNLAGVPSIIYGLLGLAVFVRTMRPITSGEVFGLGQGNGNTVLSAALTMGLLILPLIIINAQEAIQAVQPSIRQASFGLGATKWQTVWNHVLPYAMPGILTGTILAISRAVGETAPLVVVGASAFILKDPSGPFSRFTALPIQIYSWTEQPRDADKAVAAAAIILLLALLLTLNSIAILLRNRFERNLGRH
ncbi:MAG: phosphate ABC transporter permease PstA [Anaerolineales bacterium]|nr:phosphate ABC transporter permease PstA [Anaerolineales bacterium]